MPSTPYDVRDTSGVRQVFHFSMPSRSSATRGVTALAPVFQIAGMFEDLNFAKLVQAQVVSCFALFRYREASTAGGDLPSVQSYGAQTTETQGDGNTRLIDDLAPAAEITGAPGERIEGFSPDVPNTNYFEHAKLLLSMIAVNLGMPYSMLMLDSGGNSWSSVRVDYDESRRGFRRIQNSLIERWHSPIYRWKLRHFAAEDSAIGRLLEERGRLAFKHQWRPPTWPYVQPIDDATGQLLRVRNGLTSPRRLHGELSQDWEEIADETIKDNAFAISKAMATADEVNANKGDQQPVHWRELLSLPTPDGLQLTMPVATSQAPQQEPA
jgi:capsid protein